MAELMGKAAAYLLSRPSSVRRTRCPFVTGDGQLVERLELDSSKNYNFGFILHDLNTTYT